MLKIIVMFTLRLSYVLMISDKAGGVCCVTLATHKWRGRHDQWRGCPPPGLV